MVASIHTGAKRLTQAVMGSKHAMVSLHALTSLFRAVVFTLTSDLVVGRTY